MIYVADVLTSKTKQKLNDLHKEAVSKQVYLTSDRPLSADQSNILRLHTHL